MPLACILGVGPPELVDLLGYHPKVDPRHAVIVGLRDVDAMEKPQVRDSGIRAFTMRDIDERPRSRHTGPRRRDVPRSPFGNGNDL